MENLIKNVQTYAKAKNCTDNEIKLCIGELEVRMSNYWELSNRNEDYEIRPETDHRTRNFCTTETTERLNGNENFFISWEDQ